MFQKQVGLSVVAKNSILLVCGLLLATNQQLLAQESSKAQPKAGGRSPASAFPDSTIAYLNAQPPTSLANLLLNHPLRDRIESIPQVKAALKSKQFAAFLAGVGMAQVYTGMEWEESLDTAAGGGIALGFDPKQNSVGAMLITKHPKRLPKLTRDLLKLANKNPQTKVNEGEYRGKTAFAVGEQVYLILLEDRVLAANKKPMVKKMLDCWLDENNNLVSSKDFTKVESAHHDRTVWAWANLQAIRDAGLAKELFREKTPNIGAELIVGGILEATRNGKYVSASINLQDDGLELTVQTDLDESKIPSQRNYFFGSQKERKEFRRLKLDNTLGEIYAYRDLGKLWLSKEDLFDENHLAELSQADSTISTLFSGLDVGEEILGSTLPGVQVIARNQDYGSLETPEPNIKVPEFALVFRLKPDSESIQRRFRVAYQSFIGFLNIQLAMQGQPQLELESEKRGNARIVSATYLPEKGKENVGLINYNFSPSISFANDWFVIASTRKIAEDLAQAGLENATSNDPTTNTAIKIYGKPAMEILSQNAEQLIAQNMLEEGNDRPQAKAQIDLLLKLVGLVKDTTLSLENSDGKMSLKFGLELDLQETK